MANTAYKMHGAHNDFVLIDERPARGPLGEASDGYERLARAVCSKDGEFGGADGLLVVRDAANATAEMRIFNADGSEAEMCGNGVRCVARFLHERGAGERFTIATLAGPIEAEVTRSEPFAARVGIGTVAFPRGTGALELELDGARWTYYHVSLGNPHAVTFVPDVDAVDLETLGRAFQCAFPNGTNLHVVQQVGPSDIKVRHYERGVGLTQACGTGAVAAAAATMLVKSGVSPTRVRVPGGELLVDWRPGQTARLTGPAEAVFERALT